MGRTHPHTAHRTPVHPQGPLPRCPPGWRTGISPASRPASPGASRWRCAQKDDRAQVSPRPRETGCVPPPSPAEAIATWPRESLLTPGWCSPPWEQPIQQDQDPAVLAGPVTSPHSSPPHPPPTHSPPALPATQTLSPHESHPVLPAQTLRPQNRDRTPGPANKAPRVWSLPPRNPAPPQPPSPHASVPPTRHVMPVTLGFPQAAPCR